MLKESYRVMKKRGFLLLQTYPNRYFYCFIKFNKYSIIPLFLVWLPKNLYSKAIDMYHKGVMLLKHTKWKITRNVSKGTHINCQTLESISELVKSAGFKIDVGFAENTYTEFERTKFALFMERLLKNNSITKQNIYIRAIKI